MAAPHVHIAIQGTMPGGEIFVTGFDVAGEAGNQETLQAEVDAVAAFLTTTSTNQSAIRGLISSEQAYTRVTGYSYAGATGSASLIALKNINVVGTGSLNQPNQIAIVASLRTGLPGRRFRGRMFWPGTGIAVSTGGQMTQSTVTGIATAVAALLNSPGPNLSAVVVSAVAQAATPITQVQVDSRFDVIRKRAEKQTALYSGTATV